MKYAFHFFFKESILSSTRSVFLKALLTSFPITKSSVSQYIIKPQHLLTSHERAQKSPETQGRIRQPSNADLHACATTLPDTPPPSRHDRTLSNQHHTYPVAYLPIAPSHSRHSTAIRNKQHPSKPYQGRRYTIPHPPPPPTQSVSTRTPNRFHPLNLIRPRTPYLAQTHNRPKRHLPALHLTQHLHHNDNPLSLSPIRSHRLLTSLHRHTHPHPRPTANPPGPRGPKHGTSSPQSPHAIRVHVHKHDLVTKRPRSETYIRCNFLSRLPTKASHLFCDGGRLRMVHYGIASPAQKGRRTHLAPVSPAPCVPGDTPPSTAPRRDKWPQVHTYIHTCTPPHRNPDPILCRISITVRTLRRPFLPTRLSTALRPYPYLPTHPSLSSSPYPLPTHTSPTPPPSPSLPAHSVPLLPPHPPSHQTRSILQAPVRSMCGSLQVWMNR